ncbi:MAG: endolytic transglycosylase MltG [Candidatus Paceibacterota bacterium]|jgi:UPF0755 protein
MNVIQKIKSVFGILLNQYRSLGSKKKELIPTILVLVVVTMSALYFSAFQKPAKEIFPILARIESGSSLGKTADILEDAGVIKSKFWFTFFVYVRGGQSKIAAGDYYFEEPANVLKVAKLISVGEHNLITFKITIPEGTSVLGIARLFEKKIPHFDTDKFIKLAASKEGYLFPDTYFFPINSVPETIIPVLEKTFTEKIKTITADIEKFKKPIKDVLTMASILEEEANNERDRKIVAGILWKRIAIGMPLQVDAAFAYAVGISTYDLTLADLKEDSPYNTYTNRGLPPGPITNPGIESLQAAVTPIKTEYLYYLSDRKGVMHYAKDFEGHKANKALYLN